ncbi:O-antigen ligase family protein [Metapseudomonas lalkuanensis]|uniref:O-antigen ligase family protein n=1 Tax=Metapseudomonas lalkuanensis TaxID=2604832 RepID=A0A5J6QIA1_9GAMM|nr:O-antigen ligase family protein [Pseudomonas lalkuanensis]QEY62227.1 O-antigen ligase family protein [Pseudomonas lalkuanensis]
MHGAIAEYKTTKTSFQKSLFLFFPYFLVLGNLKIWLGASSVTLPLALFVVLPVLVVEVFRRSDTRSTLFLLVYGFLLFLGLVSSAYNPQTSWGRHVASLIPVGVGGVVLLCFKGVSYSPKLSVSIRNAGILLGGLVWCKFLYGILQVFLKGGGFYELKSHMSLPLGDSNFLAVYLVFFLAFTVEKSRLWSSLFIFSSVLLTMSRFGAVFSVLTFLFAYGIVRFTVTALVLPLAVICFSVFLLFIFNMEGALALLKDGFFPSLLARVELWDQGRNIVQSSPVLGDGPGGFTTYLEVVQWPRSEWGNHSWILSIWIEYGFTGLLLYLFLISLFFLQTPVENRLIGKRIKLGVAMTLIYGLFENVTGVSSYEALFAFSICVLLSLRRLDQQHIVENRLAT